jgi:hypothetical protein
LTHYECPSDVIGYDANSQFGYDRFKRLVYSIIYHSVREQSGAHVTCEELAGVHELYALGLRTRILAGFGLETRPFWLRAMPWSVAFASIALLLPIRRVKIL